MKKFKYLLGIACLAGLFSFSSCSKDDENVSNIVFPEVQTIQGEIGKTGKLEFKTTTNWKLSSSALWCKFIVDGDKLNSLSGIAGNHTIEFLVTDDGAEFEKEHTAEISLIMGGEEKVIFEITRPGKEYEIIATNIDGAIISQENPFAPIYRKYTNFKVTANFNWAVVESPEWLLFNSEISANAGVEHTIQAIVNDKDNITSKSGEIVISNKSGSKTFVIPVYYDGLPANEILFQLDAPSNSPWNWNFSADGKSFYGSSVDGSITEYDAPMKISVKARNNEYHIVYIEDNAKWGCKVLQFDYEQWFHATDDHLGNIAVSVDANTNSEKRRGYVMVFPKEVYASIAENFDEMVFEFTGDQAAIKAEYVKFTALDINQAAETANGGFVSINKTGGADIKMEMFSAVENWGPEMVMEQYGTTNVWILTLENQVYDLISIKPNGGSKWSMYQPETFFKGVNTAWPEVIVEGTFDEEFFGIINISNVKPNCSTGQMIISVMDGQGEITGIVIVEQW
ncbi:MAG: DUF5003 domain-containing protein [Bacteroidales bacterium]